jgi:ribonucleotide monophosphatase NagD (HAD superfamily)
MCIGIRYATGREPFVIGKPKPTMIDIVCKNLKVPKEKAVLVGDRLYTDIASGLNAGITTVLVLSGEATEEDLKTTEFVPTLVIDDVAEINRVLHNTLARKS